MKKNLYELLEVSPEANQEQIKASMIRLGKVYATKGQTNEAARAYFNQIKEAYRILSNPYLREGYDESLKSNQEWRKSAQALRQIKKGALKEWQFSKRLFLKVWKLGRRLFRLTHHINIKKPNLQKAIKAQNKPDKPEKVEIPPQRATTRYLRKILIPGEKIMYQANTHWFFYFDVGAILLVSCSSYLLIYNPNFIHDHMPTVSLWVPKLFSKELLEVSVWRLGLMTLWFIGMMMLWEIFVIKQTTELAITSKRVISKCGLMSRTLIELKLRRFESITIEQSLLGRLLNYGTITIMGMGGVKTTVPNIIAPLKFKKVLWQVLEYQTPEDD